jgi:hypothetical protein
MAGAMVHAVYTADDGSAYSVRMPGWEYNMANAAATIHQTTTLATTEPPLPKGIRRRKRYYYITAHDVEGSVTVLDPASSLWTAPLGSLVEVPEFGLAAPTANNAQLRGRTGERTKLN